MTTSLDIGKKSGHVPISFTVPEVAKMLRIGKSSLYAAIERGEFPHVKIGSRVLVPRNELEKMFGEISQ